MDDESEIELKRICCTCLSIDRNLIQLCKINDGVNNLYFLLSYDPEAYKEGFFKDSASLHICWECRALIRRVICFRLQACIAQKHLSTLKTKHLKCLSRLSTNHKTTYDNTISSSHPVEDNFIDCNAVEVKIEIDDEDIPLSKLHSDTHDTSVGEKSENSSEEYREDDLNAEDIALNEIHDKFSNDENPFKSNKKIKKEKYLKRKTRKKSEVDNNKYFKAFLMKEDDMFENRERKRTDVDFINAASKCESCVEGFKSEIELDEHNLSQHTEKPNHNICDICLSYIPTTSLIEHRKDHFKKYTCQLCEYYSFSLDSMVTHLRIEHGLEKLGATVKRKKGVHKALPVPRPGSKPRRKPTLMDQQTPFGYQCTECNKYFENKNQRWKHVQRCHREGFRCHSCGKRFAFKHSLSRHEQLHTGPPPREECPVCRKMIRVDLLRIHSRIHSARESFSCVACEKSFVSRASYQHHLKYTKSHSNTDILKYKCNICDKGYRSRGELRDHENYQHKGHTQHQCPICGKALATRRCITRHVRRAHDGVKESARDKICQQCGKAFRDKKGLREHEFIHTGERPLSCEVCGSTFRQSASLYTHKKRVHKIHAPRKQVQLLEGAATR